jgi:hypothetical protein
MRPSITSPSSVGMQSWLSRSGRSSPILSMAAGRPACAPSRDRARALSVGHVAAATLAWGPAAASSHGRATLCQVAAYEALVTPGSHAPSRDGQSIRSRSGRHASFPVDGTLWPDACPHRQRALERGGGQPSSCAPARQVPSTARQSVPPVTPPGTQKVAPHSA